MDASQNVDRTLQPVQARPVADAQGGHAGGNISRAHVPFIHPDVGDQAPMLSAPGQVPSASSSQAAFAERRRVAAARLFQAVLGRDLNFAERARMQSSATIMSVESHARRTSRTVSDHLSPRAVLTAAVGLGAVGAARPSGAVDVARQALRLAPALLPGAALYAGATLTAHLLPTEALSALDRIAHGPHAETLETWVRGLLASRPEAQEAVRATLLDSLTTLERLVEASPSPAVQSLLQRVLADALTVGDVETSRSFFLDGLPAIECLTDLQAEAPPWLNLLRNLLGPDAEPIWRAEPLTAGLAAFNALANAQASGLAGLIDRMCPLGPESGRANDRLLSGLIMIAAGVKAEPVLAFIKARLHTCADAPAFNKLRERLADAMPALRAMAHSAMGPPVLRAFDHIVAGAAAQADPAELQLALLEQINALDALFRQLASAASAASSIAFDNKRVPRFGVNEGHLRVTTLAALQLAASPQLSGLLGLTTKEAAVGFWLSKAADRTLRS